MASPRHDIVVIAASGGGVEALVTLMSGLSSDLQASLFITLHIPPKPESQLPLILHRQGLDCVIRPRDHEHIRPGCAYIAPPDHHLLVERGHVALSHDAKENGHRPAADPMFRSAAEAYGPRVVGVILSGALDDGTAGLQRIKERGGIAVVQDPNEAMFSGMPRSAVQNVSVDHVVRIVEMAKLLKKLVLLPASPRSSPRVRHNGAKTQSNPQQSSAVLICPDCGGPLSENQEGRASHFVCRTGHAYSIESLLEEDGENLERALWISLRTLQDKSMLEQKLANQARNAGQNEVARYFNKKARATVRQSAPIRELLNLRASKKELQKK
jgi:two-component system chemotaxis response regulator CheB